MVRGSGLWGGSEVGEGRGVRPFIPGSAVMPCTGPVCSEFLGIHIPRSQEALGVAWIVEVFVLSFCPSDPPLPTTDTQLR